MRKGTSDRNKKSHGLTHGSNRDMAIRTDCRYRQEAESRVMGKRWMEPAICSAAALMNFI